MGFSDRLNNALSEDKYPIRTICAWCEKDMGLRLEAIKPTDEVQENGEWISHSICPNCRANVEGQMIAASPLHKADAGG